MFKRILVTTDFSTHSFYAIQRAVQFAHSVQAELICVHVINQGWMDGGDAIEQDWVHKAEEAHEQELKQLIAPYPMQFKVLDGRVPDEIIKFIQEHSINMVFMGAHGTYYLNDFILGTNSEAVLKQSPIPMHLIRQSPTAREYARVLVCTDFSDASKKAIEVAYKAYPQAEFLLLHVADVWYEKMVKPHMHDSLQDKLNKFLASCAVDPSRFSVKFIGGYPANDIPQYAKDWGADLVVLGTRGHSALYYVLMGRVSDRLVRVNPTDMLIVP
ncbi:universal stress protein [Legionella saoudiensis]|uniref:universal stress protein n=1 Tax=Legionella saoudiensis TaxID=1750561 RepID=UPI0007319225|nr:universal stress protein [Legionella saoudiensis]